jgi:hypothetical protein
VNFFWTVNEPRVRIGRTPGLVPASMSSEMVGGELVDPDLDGPCTGAKTAIAVFEKSLVDLFVLIGQ